MDFARYCARDGAYYAVIMRTISVKLPDELIAQLARVAKARRVTKSCLVRESLEKGLHDQPPAGEVSCYDLARDLAGYREGTTQGLGKQSEIHERFWPVKKGPGLLDTGPLVSFFATGPCHLRMRVWFDDRNYKRPERFSR